MSGSTPAPSARAAGQGSGPAGHPSRSRPFEIADRPSPNRGERRGGALPDMVVLHYTAMESVEAAASRLCDPAAEVSAHYLIAPDGTVLRLVPEELRAWHAGTAHWGGVEDVNSRSIGIELANPGHHFGYPPFPEPQMAALEALLADILARWSIPPERVLGHACVAPGRKIDPGENLDWRRLARRRLAVWLDPGPLAPARGAQNGDADAAQFQSAARAIGYATPDTGRWDDDTLSVWRSFAMRFLPAHAALPPFAEGVAHAQAIAARHPAEKPRPSAAQALDGGAGKA